MDNVISFFEGIGNLIPFLQKYSVSVKVTFSLCLLFGVLTVILMIFTKKEADLPAVTPVNTADSTVVKLEPKSKKKRSQPKTTPMSQNNSNAGTNNGNIGGSNNTVNNVTNYNLGTQPRVINSTALDDFVNQFPDKNIHIRFMAYDGVSGDMDFVKEQTITLLRSKGYTNIDTSFNSKYGSPHPQQMIYAPNDIGGVTFHIPHNR